jgi:hypothetical protein
MRKKIILFAIAFSVVFRLLRVSYHGKLILAESLQDLGGLPWLYSTVGVIFGVIAAFIIEKEWDRWNLLVEATKGETYALRQLWRWAAQIKDAHVGDILKERVVKYLKIVEMEWDVGERGEKSGEVSAALNDLRDTVSVAMRSEKEIGSVFERFFSKLSDERESRLHFSSLHIPEVVRKMFLLATIILIALSLCIGVKSIVLDYIFTLLLGILVYTIYLVVDDLNHPFRPGSWHLTPKEYHMLAERLSEKNDEL